VKLYLDEPGRDAVLRAAAGQSVVATQEIAYIEAHAAVARAEREGRLSSADFDRLRSDFNGDWPNYFVIRISPGLFERAVRLVDAFALRAYDTVHLAAARALADDAPPPLLFVLRPAAQPCCGGSGYDAAGIGSFSRFFPPHQSFDGGRFIRYK
jgi:uncharacterized protein